MICARVNGNCEFRTKDEVLLSVPDSCPRNWQIFSHSCETNVPFSRRENLILSQGGSKKIKIFDLSQGI